jgi:DNA-3-methyladenine glycosylase II
MDFKTRLAEAADHLAARDPKLANVISTYGKCLLRPHNDYYAELVTSIVGQQLSIKAAASIWQRVLSLSGGEPPSPQFLVGVSDEKLRAAGLSRAKALYVKDLAEHILDGRLDMDHIATLPNEEVIAQLTAVKGIGEWSAHMFMIFSLGRLDILPWGDLGIRKAAQNIYGLADLPDKAKLERIAAKNKWAPYQSVAAWYLWKSLENEGIRIKKTNT